MTKIDNIADDIRNKILKISHDYKFSPMTESIISNLKLDFCKIVHELVTSRDIIISDKGSTIILSDEYLVRSLLPLIPIYDKGVLAHSHSSVYVNTHYYGEVCYKLKEVEEDIDSDKMIMHVGYPCYIAPSAPAEYIQMDFTISN